MKLIIQSFVLIFLSLCLGCETVNENWQADADKPELVHKSMKQITDVIVHDIFSPPVASRIYAYSAIAGYEALRQGHPEYKALAGQLTDLKPLPAPEADKEYCFPLASVHARNLVGKAMIFSENKMETFEEETLQAFREIKMPKEVFDRSLAYGEMVAQHILDWADKDNYKQTRTFPKYSITDDPAAWKPTPPDYMDGIEPHWNKIRPFVIDNPANFAPPPPTPFNMEDKDGQFYKEVLEVYNALGDTEEERSKRIAIAEFWDCNPYVSHHKGHVMFATKKITPGGHWVGITRIACEKAEADMMRSSEAYAWTTIALADAFIACWDEKYRSKLVRPETVINEYLDEDWLPALQTPPFPEYTSGHSVISRAAAIALTHLFGENFEYTDDVELEYGLPARNYSSFIEASEEAAISRLYGGIHYAPACFVGVQQGEKVGTHITQNLTTSSGQIGQK